MKAYRRRTDATIARHLANMADLATEVEVMQTKAAEWQRTLESMAEALRALQKTLDDLLPYKKESQ